MISGIYKVFAKVNPYETHWLDDSKYSKMETLSDLVCLEIMKYVSMQALGNIRLTCRSLFNLSLYLRENILHVFLSFLHHLYINKPYQRTFRNKADDLDLGCMILSLVFIKGSQLHILVPYPHDSYDTFDLNFQIENFSSYQHFYLREQFCTTIAKYLPKTNNYDIKEIHISKNEIKLVESVYFKLTDRSLLGTFFTMRGESAIIQFIEENVLHFNEYNYFTGELLFSLKQNLKPEMRTLTGGDTENDFFIGKHFFRLFSIGQKFHFVNAKNLKTLRYNQIGNPVYFDHDYQVIRVPLKTDFWFNKTGHNVIYFNPFQKCTQSFLKHNRIWDYPSTHGCYLSNGQKFEFNEYSHAFIDIFPISAKQSDSTDVILEKVDKCPFFAD